MIAAMDEKRGVGLNNQLPWHIPEDLAHFKKITLNHPIIMGRKTYESIGKPLPKRTNIVVTRQKNYKANGVIIHNSIDEAVHTACKIDKKEVFIIGGANLYKQGINLSAKLYLTIIKGVYKADCYFPDYSSFTKILRKEEKTNKNHRFTFIELEKQQK
jgi:dihydrofolate reductase